MMITLSAIVALAHSSLLLFAVPVTIPSHEPQARRDAAFADYSKTCAPYVQPFIEYAVSRGRPRNQAIGTAEWGFFMQERMEPGSNTTFASLQLLQARLNQNSYQQDAGARLLRCADEVAIRHTRYGVPGYDRGVRGGSTSAPRPQLATKAAPKATAPSGNAANRGAWREEYRNKRHEFDRLRASYEGGHINDFWQARYFYDVKQMDFLRSLKSSGDATEHTRTIADHAEKVRNSRRICSELAKRVCPLALPTSRVTAQKKLTSPPKGERYWLKGQIDNIDALCAKKECPPLGLVVIVHASDLYGSRRTGKLHPGSFTFGPPMTNGTVWRIDDQIDSEYYRCSPSIPKGIVFGKDDATNEAFAMPSTTIQCMLNEKGRAFVAKGSDQ